jgi:hypothetical protein
VVVRVRVDASGARRLLRESPEAVRRSIRTWLGLAGHETAGTMRRVIAERVSHRATGHLMRSVAVDVGTTSATVGPTAEYAEWVDQPTRPHVIESRGPWALAFPSAGAKSGFRAGRRASVFKFGGKTTVRGLVYARRVFHPGTKGLHFIDETARRIEEPVTRLLDETLTSELKRLGGES